MSFWSQASSEPRRQHRFLLAFPELGGYQEYLAKTVTKPSYTIGETEHKFLGNTYYYPGAVSWDAITATLINAIKPDGNKIFYRALYASGYFDPNDQQAFMTADQAGSATPGPGTPNKLSARNALGDVLIKEINGAGQLIGTWKLNNPWITNVKFGDLDYSGEELLNIELSIRYDWATYIDKDAPSDNMQVEYIAGSVISRAAQ
jgi:hypothetical protein